MLVFPDLLQIELIKVAREAWLEVARRGSRGRDDRWKIYVIGIDLLGGRGGGRLEFGGAAFRFPTSPAPATAATDIVLGRTGSATSTRITEESRFVLFGDVRSTRLDLIFQLGFDVAFRPFRTGGEEFRPERGVGGTKPLATRYVTGLTRPTMREQAVAIATGFRWFRSAFPFGVGGALGYPGSALLSLEIGRGRISTGRTFHALVWSGREFARPALFTTP